eukprot:scaffold9715_cov113-Isochrysis_galbana.AAC.15
MLWSRSRTVDPEAWPSRLKTGPNSAKWALKSSNRAWEPAARGGHKMQELRQARAGGRLRAELPGCSWLRTQATSACRRGEGQLPFWSRSRAAGWRSRPAAGRTMPDTLADTASSAPR